MKRLSLCALAAIASTTLLAYAAMTPESQREIEHLLGYVGSSGCDFYRNGTWYSGEKGKAHLNDKYNYAKKRGLSTAEEFVDKVAASSSLSGRPYKVRCGGKEIIAREWLSQELQRYRSTAASPAPAASAQPETPPPQPAAQGTTSSKADRH